MTRHTNLVQTLIFLVLLALSACSSRVSALLLSDLSTPSFVVDMRALRKRSMDIDISNTLPSLYLPKNDMTLYPSASSGDATSTKSDYDAPSIKLDLQDTPDEAAIGYLHTTVVRARDDAIEGQDDPVDSFLAELDLTPSLCGKEGARLVLGLNNHHVGSYYWARSAGAGSSMDAIGIIFGDNERNRGILRWEDEDGPIACNSNDGKRSEWVNFLRAGDTVQLVPIAGQESLMEFLEKYGCVYGVSSDGRPLGSEPAVVCEWRC